MAKSAVNQSKVCILAGGGHLPTQLAQACLDKDIPYFIIGLKSFVDEAWLASHPHKIIRLGSVGKIFKTLKKNKVERVVFAGHIHRPSWTEIIPDLKGALLLKKLKGQPRGDNALLTFLAKEIQNEGFAIIGTQDIDDTSLTPHGILTVAEPTDKNWQDIRYGVAIAKQIGGADIGQSIVIQDGLVLGVEAIEGTSALIERCGSYKRKTQAPILIKTKKPQQDERLDLPTIGVKTIEAAVKAGFSGIALEAGQTLFIERDQAIDMANQHGIFIVGFNEEDLG